jgi:YesN/AraC family two-component response regulator
MPEMTGVQLSKKMLDVRPDIPIILCTGFSEMVSREEALGLGIKEYLKKPIIYKDMAKRIREILDDARA